LQRALPYFLAGRQLQAVHHSFGAERVDMLAGNERRRARAGIKAEIVLVARGISKLPLLFPRSGIKACDDFLIALAVEENEQAVRHDRTAPACSDFALPDNARSLFGPSNVQASFRGHAVASWSEKLRPILRTHAAARKKHGNSQEQMF